MEKEPEATAGAPELSSAPRRGRARWIHFLVLVGLVGVGTAYYSTSNVLSERPGLWLNVALMVGGLCVAFAEVLPIRFGHAAPALRATGYALISAVILGTVVIALFWS